MGLVTRLGLIGSLCLAGTALAACGADRAIEPAATLPPPGTAYRGLDANHRVAVAAACRNRAAAAQHSSASGAAPRTTARTRSSAALVSG
jgi:hypothetical protein